MQPLLDMKLDLAIAIIAYQRPCALRRLLSSVSSADFRHSVRLYFIIDGGADSVTVGICRDFRHQYLKHIVIEQPENIGLRRNVIFAGGLSSKHDGVIVLEDDIVVANDFYDYAQAASIQCLGIDRIASISLFTPEYNEFAGLPFDALNDGSTGFLMQTGSSWGQCWLREDWESFFSWYQKNYSHDFSNLRSVPHCVLRWPETSWKKFFNIYLALTGRYTFFPYRARSSNAAEPGVHYKLSSFINQVKLPSPNVMKEHYTFSPMTSMVKYDAFMEPDSDFVYEWLGLARLEVEFDLFNIKSIDKIKSKPLFLTTMARKGAVGSYPLSFRPIENNFRFKSLNENDDGIFLVDTSVLKAKDLILPLNVLSWHSRINMAPIFRELRTSFNSSS